ncbi:MAG: carotenoid biosynthesis protein [Candidatus Aenigmatarchaeota archaeon]
MNHFLFTELGIILMYFICLIYVIKKDKSMLPFLLSTTFYALFFENMNILISSGKEGSYYYNKNFFINIFHLPLFVALAWSIIMYTSFKIAKSVGVSKKSLPMAAALLVLLIDLSIDVVAIRLGYWFWVGYEFKDGYFGVPASNFIGWLLVSFSFFYLEQNIKMKSWLKYLFLPFLSYFTFLLLFIPITLIEEIFVLNKGQQFLIFMFLLIIFFVSIKKDSNKTAFNIFIYSLRMPFYFFGLYFILSKHMYEENILLLFLSIFFLIVELALMFGEIKCIHKKK